MPKFKPGQRRWCIPIGTEVTVQRDDKVGIAGVVSGYMRQHNVDCLTELIINYERAGVHFHTVCWPWEVVKNDA